MLLLGVIVLHLGLNVAGLWSWQCPLPTTIGIDCPGCGLTRSVISLLHGRIWVSLSEHLFGGVAVCFGLLLVINVLLPERIRMRYIATVKKWELSSGFMQIVLGLWLVYWLFRLVQHAY
ncbi:DUF2752 domain-containing protein [Poriferisphaera sp. WC338]|uniref:DUF2752 domain-containing protein n=1 Tax=Poriferisphaera sp. WC338 TaxID=3425129 RepID=UPI003D81388F